MLQPLQTCWGGHAGVTDSTVLQYLGIVEQRTNELLQLQAFIQAKVEHTTGVGQC